MNPSTRGFAYLSAQPPSAQRKLAKAPCLARGAGVSQATGYRYLHEGIDVLAAHAPDLPEVLDHCRQANMSHVVLDGTLIVCDRVAGTTEKGNDLGCSGKARHFAGNLQFIAAPTGTRCGSRTLSQDRYTICGLPVSMPCQRCMPPPATACQSWPTSATPVPASAPTHLSAPTPTSPHPSRRTTAPTTDSNAASARSANAPQPNSNNAGEPSNTSPQSHHIGTITQAALVLNNTWNDRG